MSIEIVVPDLGEAGTEATIDEWLVKEGDAVKAGEPIVVIETDKVAMDVDAEADGVLQSINHQAGEDVAVGTVLGVIDESADASASKSAPEPADEPADTNGAAPAAAEPSAGGQAVTPVAQRMAEAENVDITKVTGTGERGKVTREDVESYLSQQKQQASQPKQAAPTPQSKPAASGTPDADRPRADEEDRERMSRRRRTIARRSGRCAADGRHAHHV